MGEMADYYIDQMMFFEHNHEEVADIDYTKWPQKSGVEIRVSKMTDKHIINTLNMLRRDVSFIMFSGWIDTFENELKRRGVSERRNLRGKGNN